MSSEVTVPAPTAPVERTRNVITEHALRARKTYISPMGRLKYDGTSDPIVIEDETLAHLKIVIATKLRRQESFMMTWMPRDGGPDRRATVWIHPTIPLQFGFDEAQVSEIDPRRVTEMMQHLNATGELVLDHVLASEGPHGR